MSVYDDFGGYVALPIAVAIVAGIILYYFVTNILPWLILIAIVIGGIWFFLWSQSTKRSEHPWS